MSRGSEKTRILRERARKLAERRQDSRPLVSVEHVLVVEAGGAVIGLPFTQLHEVVQAPPVVPLPTAPSFVEGIASVRGHLVSVVNLAAVLDGDASRRGSLLVLLETPKGLLGLRIESVQGAREISEVEIAESLSADRRRANAVRAITKDLVCLLHLEYLLSAVTVNGETGRPDATEEFAT